MKPVEVLVERESVEYLEVDVLLDGNVLVADISFAVSSPWERPTTFVPSVDSNGRTAVLIDGPTLGEGHFHVYAKYAGSGESPVIHAAIVKVT